MYSHEELLPKSSKPIDKTAGGGNNGCKNFQIGFSKSNIPLKKVTNHGEEKKEGKGKEYL